MKSKNELIINLNVDWRMLAVLLEAAGPLSVIGAQVAYLAEPLFGGVELRALGRVLEDPEKTRRLIDGLRSGPEDHHD